MPPQSRATLGTVPDELEAFRGEPEHDVPRASTAKVERAVLVFEYDAHMFAVDAKAIDAVVAWRDPTPVPQGDEWLLGVLQERGRIVAVLRHPLGRAETSAQAPLRVIVCATKRGLLGLPTTATKAVDSIAFDEEPVHAMAVDSSAGVVTYVDVALLLQTLLS
jgi:chemotaxis signal transduction protein